MYIAMQQGVQIHNHRMLPHSQQLPTYYEVAVCNAPSLLPAFRPTERSGNVNRKSRIYSWRS